MSPQDTPSPNIPPLRFLRMKDVEERVGLNKRTIQRMVRAKSFPEPIRLHERSIAFVESEVAAWMEARMSDRVEVGDD
jgi:prophage regulatory protein